MEKETKKIVIIAKKYMERHGISIYWLSKKTGIRYQTLHSILNNKNKQVTLKHLWSIADALNIKDMNIMFKKVG